MNQISNEKEALVALQQENELLKSNLEIALNALYVSIPYKPAKLTFRKEYDRVNKRVEIWIDYSCQRRWPNLPQGTYTIHYRIVHPDRISRFLSKSFTANQNNMGYFSFMLEAVNVDGAYQYPFKEYSYHASCDNLTTDLIIHVPDRTKPPIGDK